MFLFLIQGSLESGLPDAIVYGIIGMLLCPLITLSCRPKFVPKDPCVPVLLSCITVALLVIGDVAMPIYRAASFADNSPAVRYGLIKITLTKFSHKIRKKNKKKKLIIKCFYINLSNLFSFNFFTYLFIYPYLIYYSQASIYNAHSSSMLRIFTSDRKSARISSRYNSNSLPFG